MNMNPNTPINGTNPASCNEGPAAFCDGYAQGYPHGVESFLGDELGAKAADHDYWNLKGPGTQEKEKEVPPSCPSAHTTDWCNGWSSGYSDEWNIFSDGD